MKQPDFFILELLTNLELEVKKYQQKLLESQHYLANLQEENKQKEDNQYELLKQHFIQQKDAENLKNMISNIEQIEVDQSKKIRDFADNLLDQYIQSSGLSNIISELVHYLQKNNDSVNIKVSSNMLVLVPTADIIPDTVDRIRVCVVGKPIEYIFDIEQLQFELIQYVTESLL